MGKWVLVGGYEKGVKNEVAEVLGTRDYKIAETCYDGGAVVTVCYTNPDDISDDEAYEIANSFDIEGMEANLPDSAFAVAYEGGMGHHVPYKDDTEFGTFLGIIMGSDEDGSEIYEV